MHVWYHCRSKAAPLLVIVIGPSPAGPKFLHIQYRGTGNKVLDHTAAKLSQLEIVQDASPESPGSPTADKGASPQPVPTATPHLPIAKPAPKRGKKRVLQTFIDQWFQPIAPAKDDTHNDTIMVLTGCVVHQACLFSSLMQPMSPIAPKSEACRKPIGAYWRKTWCPLAVVKWYFFVVPPPPGGNRHFVTVPLLGGELARQKGGDFKGG